MSNKQMYCSSTAALAVLTGPVLTVAHVGDSRIALGRQSDGDVAGTFLTRDHKPNLPKELARIEAAGGSLAYLHGGKPFIRGGDFAALQKAGHRPKQLNYSRALGGPGLKPWGLSAQPTLLQVQLQPADKYLVLASDGVWDVMSATEAVHVVHEATLAGCDPAAALVQAALALHEAGHTTDNVTAIVVFLSRGEELDRVPPSEV